MLFCHISNVTKNRTLKTIKPHIDISKYLEKIIAIYLPKKELYRELLKLEQEINATDLQ